MIQMPKEKISLVMVVHNEAGIIEKVIRNYYKEISKKFPKFEFIIAEDGSTDGTKEILKKLEKELPIKLFMGSKRKGYLKAVKDALKLAKNDIIFFSDSDGQHLPEDFWKLYKKIKDNDMVVGFRPKRKDSFYRRFFSKCYNKIVNFLFGINFLDINCGFRILKKKLVNDITNEVKHLENGFFSEFTIRACKKGYKITEVPVQHIERKYGVTSQFTLKKIPKVLFKNSIGLINLKKELS